MSSFGTIKRLNKSTRDYIAIGIWFAVLAGALFLDTDGQSKLMTAGLMFLLTGAYSTFLLCERPRLGPLVHGAPYAFALMGTVLLCLSPNFRHPVEAGLIFLAVTAMMHGFVVHDMQKETPEAEEPDCVGEYVT